MGGSLVVELAETQTLNQDSLELPPPMEVMLKHLVDLEETERLVAVVVAMVDLALL